MSQVPEWRFKPKEKNDKSIDPFQEGLFSSGDMGFNDSLVREAIQNSLDAMIGSGPVKVKFELRNSQKGLDPSTFNGYVDGLRPHIEAEDNGITDFPDLDSNIPYLLIEDFGTTGLEGDPGEGDEDDNPNSKHNFLSFWRSVGRSKKSSSERGRWGLGKAVYMRSSKINSYYGLTIRDSDKRELLMGQSILKIHKCKDDKYLPYGDFGIFKNEPGERYFGYPIEDKSYINTFKHDFNIGRKDEPGFSLLIPFPDEEINFNDLAVAVIKQYFYPILAGQLEAEIKVDNKILHLKKEKIHNELGKIDFSSSNYTIDYIYSLFDFVENIIFFADNEYYELKVPDLNYAPRWNKSNYFDEDVIPEIQEKFDSGSILGFRVPLKVQLKKEKEPELGWFKVFLQKSSDLIKGETYFIREGVIILEESSKAQNRKERVRGFVIADENPVTIMLGDAENPSHTSWQKSLPTFKGKYEHGPTCLSFVKNSFKEIIKNISKPPEKLDFTLLSDIFSIPIDEEPELEDRKKQPESRKDKDSSPTDIPDIPKSRGWMINIDKSENGFSIKKHSEASQPPVSVKVKMAYNVIKGNPFRKYHEADFDLKDPKSSNLVFDNKNINITDIGSNYVEFDVNDENFSFSIEGFDPNRDLVVEAKSERRK